MLRLFDQTAVGCFDASRRLFPSVAAAIGSCAEQKPLLALPHSLLYLARSGWVSMVSVALFWCNGEIDSPHQWCPLLSSSLLIPLKKVDPWILNPFKILQCRFPKFFLVFTFQPKQKAAVRSEGSRTLTKNFFYEQIKVSHSFCKVIGLFFSLF